MDGDDTLAAISTAPFEIRRPVGGAARPLIFASPHSGRVYPHEMMAASALDAGSIRKSEDAFVDTLIEEATDHGATILTSVYARAYVDVNREAYELDQTMFEDELPAFAVARSARAAAGLGAIARIVAEGHEIYNRKLTFAEAKARIEAVHRPYHAALSELVEEALAAHGQALVIDWHSMPSAAGRLGRGCDFVLGDRFGQACSARVTTAVEHALQARGYRVARNNPYAGGFTTEHYGRPAKGVHALQIEIDRSLYLDEASLQPSSGFASLKADLKALFAILEADAWR